MTIEWLIRASILLEKKNWFMENRGGTSEIFQLAEIIFETVIQEDENRTIKARARALTFPTPFHHLTIKAVLDDLRTAVLHDNLDLILLTVVYIEDIGLMEGSAEADYYFIIAMTCYLKYMDDIDDEFYEDLHMLGLNREMELSEIYIQLVCMMCAQT
jgi:hypothetical protein